MNIESFRINQLDEPQKDALPLDASGFEVENFFSNISRAELHVS